MPDTAFENELVAGRVRYPQGHIEETSLQSFVGNSDPPGQQWRKFLSMVSLITSDAALAASTASLTRRWSATCAEVNSCSFPPGIKPIARSRLP
jgi:hypothetical protein